MGPCDIHKSEQSPTELKMSGKPSNVLFINQEGPAIHAPKETSNGPDSACICEKGAPETKQQPEVSPTETSTQNSPSKADTITKQSNRVQSPPAVINDESALQQDFPSASGISWGCSEAISEVPTTVETISASNSDTAMPEDCSQTCTLPDGTSGDNFEISCALSSNRCKDFSAIEPIERGISETNKLGIEATVISSEQENAEHKEHAASIQITVKYSDKDSDVSIRCSNEGVTTSEVVLDEGPVKTEGEIHFEDPSPVTVPPEESDDSDKKAAVPEVISNQALTASMHQYVEDSAQPLSEPPNFNDAVKHNAETAESVDFISTDSQSPIQGVPMFHTSCHREVSQGGGASEMSTVHVQSEVVDEEDVTNMEVHMDDVRANKDIAEDHLNIRQGDTTSSSSTDMIKIEPFMASPDANCKLCGDHGSSSDMMELVLSSIRKEEDGFPFVESDNEIEQDEDDMISDPDEVLHQDEVSPAGAEIQEDQLCGCEEPVCKKAKLLSQSEPEEDADEHVEVAPDDGSATLLQELPLESARPWPTLPSAPPCRHHVRPDNAPDGDGDDEPSGVGGLGGVNDQALDHQISLSDQLVPVEDGYQVHGVADSFYSNEQVKFKAQEKSLETLPTEISLVPLADQVIPHPVTEVSYHSCFNQRRDILGKFWLWYCILLRLPNIFSLDPFAQKESLTLKRPRLRLGLSKKQKVKPLHVSLM